MQIWPTTTFANFPDPTSIYDYQSNVSSAEGSIVVQTKDPCGYLKHNWLTAKLILISILGTTMAALGIVGNVTTTVVLTRPSMRSPNNLYLTFLAIFDTLLLISAVVLYAVEYIYEYTDSLTLYTIWLQYVKYGFALSHVAQTGSVYITVAVTFERLLAVLYPKRAKIMCTHDRASITIVIVVGFAILFNSTKYFEVEVVYVDNCTGFGAQHLVPSALLHNDIYTTVHSLWLTQFVMVFIPFIVLFAVNTAIVYKVRRSLKKLSWIQRGKKRDQLKEKSRDATRVLIVIVVVFLLCNSLGFVVTLLESLYTQKGLLDWCPNFYAFAREAVNFLAIVNSSINFVIYCIFGQDFRRELVCVWGCKKFTFMMPVGDKFTAEGLMLNSNLHRRPSMFVRYIGLIRQTSASQLHENGHRKTRKKKDDHRKMTGLTNVRGILASLQPPSNNNGVAATVVSSQRKVIITSADYDDDEDDERRFDRASKARTANGIKHMDELNVNERGLANGGGGLGVYFLPKTEEKCSGSHSNFTLSSWRERLPSNAKRRRCSSALSGPSLSVANSSSQDDKLSKLSRSNPSCSETEPLAPFLLGMLISTAPTVRQAGFETAIKNYENESEEIVWV